jgi:hypothetical protein
MEYRQWKISDVMFVRKNYDRLTTGEIAQSLGRSEWSIRKKAQLMGLKKNKTWGMASIEEQRKTITTVKLIFALQKDSMTRKEIAKVAECSERQVFRFLTIIKACNLDLRRHKGRYFIPTDWGTILTIAA